MTPTELAAVLTAIATLIGALGWGAFKSGKKESPLSTNSLVTLKDMERMIADVSGLVRGLHQEIRTDHRDMRDRLVRLEERIANLRK